MTEPPRQNISSSPLPGPPTAPVSATFRPLMSLPLVMVLLTSMVLVLLPVWLSPREVVLPGVVILIGLVLRSKQPLTNPQYTRWAESFTRRVRSRVPATAPEPEVETLRPLWVTWLGLLAAALLVGPAIPENADDRVSILVLGALLLAAAALFVWQAAQVAGRALKTVVRDSLHAFAWQREAPHLTLRRFGQALEASDTVNAIGWILTIGGSLLAIVLAAVGV